MFYSFGCGLCLLVYARPMPCTSSTLLCPVLPCCILLLGRPSCRICSITLTPYNLSFPPSSSSWTTTNQLHTPATPRRTEASLRLTTVIVSAPNYCRIQTSSFYRLSSYYIIYHLRHITSERITSTNSRLHVPWHSRHQLLFFLLRKLLIFQTSIALAA